MTPCRHASTRAGSFILILLLMLGSGCAYFNTFYLAQRNFNDAERIRTRNDDVVDAAARNAYNEAIDWASEILRSYPDSRYVDDSLFIIGMSNFHQDKYVEARIKFDELIRFFPDSELTRTGTYYKALTLIELDQMEDAALIFSDLLDTSDRDLRGLAGLGLARINLMEEDWQGLLDATERVLENDPTDEHYIEAAAKKGEALYQLERYEEAVETLQNLEEMRLPPELRFEVNSLLALVTAGLGDYETAMGYLETMQNRGEFSDFEPRIRLEIGNLYELQDADELAIDAYTRLAGDFPDSVAAKHGWYNIGMLLLKDMEQAEQAKEAFDKVTGTATEEGGEVRPVSSATRRELISQSWYLDAQIKSVQIDSLTSKRELIERLSRNADDTQESHTATAGETPDTQNGELSAPQPAAAGGIPSMLAESDVQDTSAVLPPLPPMSIDVRREQLASARFSLAELYTYSFDRPDSAMTQYRLINDEAPDSEYAIKSQYFLETYRLTQQDEFSEDNERGVMEDLIERYPESQFAQDLKVYLGILEETPDARLFMDAEHVRLNGGDPETYIPMFEQVVAQYPRTKSAYRARFLIGYAYEHDVGDRERAIDFYTELSEEEPVTESAAFIRLARDKLAMLEREEELLTDIRNNIAYYEQMIRDITSGVGLASAEDVISGEGASITDTALTGMQKIRARNARIRSRYYQN